MPILKAYHYYVLKKSMKRTSCHIPEIIPIKDREVKESFFRDYIDATKTKVEEGEDYGN